MADVLIDPVLIAAPMMSAQSEEVRAWIGRLSAWVMESLAGPHEWYHSVTATRILVDIGLFPSFERLRTLTSWCGASDINVGQLSRYINFFFQDPSHDLLDYIAGAGYYFDFVDGSVQITPSELACRWPGSVSLVMSELLSQVGACIYSGVDGTSSLVLATAPINRLRTMHIYGMVRDSIPSTLGLSDRWISADIGLLFAPDDLFGLSDLGEVWQQGETAIRSQVDRFVRCEWKGSEAGLLRYLLGEEFVSSIRISGMLTNAVMLAKLIRVMAAVVADVAGKLNLDVRPLRLSETPDSKQRVRKRDGARAWRLTLAAGGVGWRMHYWRIPVGESVSIEFANVLKKHDAEVIAGE